MRYRHSLFAESTNLSAGSELDPDGTPNGTPCSDGRPETVREVCQDHERVAP